MTMLNVYDLNRQKTAILQNAYDITETQELNKIYTLDFKMPADDEKAQYIRAFHYVRYGEDGELYRIVNTKKSESDTNTLAVSCEHVIATLCDDLMFGAVQYGGGTVRTSAVISFLLGKQKTNNWQLAECDFDRRFEYLWEQENILNALYSIPKEFTAPYKWMFDTTRYPWRLSLKAITTTIAPEYYIRAKSNLLSSDTEQNFTDICTRIYPLGYGEGVNQLGIKEINNNLPYLQAPASVIARYGIKEKVLVDRRYENAESLKAYGQTMLDALSVPSLSRSFSVVDLYPFTGAEIDNAKVGQICKLTGDETIAYITKTVRVLDDPGNLEIGLSTKATDIASTVADLADRVRIESVYAQGATQLYQHSKDANATSEKGMVLSLYFPSEMKQINKVLLRMKLGKFRSYSQTTDSDGGFSKTYSVNASSKEYSVSASEKKLSISVNKTATTDMTADKNTNLTTTAGGSASGQTSQATGGGGSGISLSPSVSVSVSDTKTANWNSFMSNNGGNVLYTGIPQDNNGNTNITGDTGNEYSHTHSFSADVENDKVSGTTGTGSSHNHSMSLLSHKHGVVVTNLTHNHAVEASVSVSINNNQSGYSGFEHSHSFAIGDHTHSINIGHQHKYNISHSHDITIPGHSHTITIPGHSHTITIDAHSHDIAPGIFEFGNPNGFYVYVNNEKLTNISTVVNGKTINSNSAGLLSSTSFDGDITSWLLNPQNQIPRNTWIDIEIRPAAAKAAEAIAYIQASVFVQGFVQSRGGGNY